MTMFYVPTGFRGGDGERGEGWVKSSVERAMAEVVEEVEVVEAEAMRVKS